MPPTGVTVKLPLEPPKQLTFTELVTEAVGLPVFNILYVTVNVHEFASFIITVCGPADNAVVEVPTTKGPPS